MEERVKQKKPRILITKMLVFQFCYLPRYLSIIDYEDLRSEYTETGKKEKMLVTLPKTNYEVVSVLSSTDVFTFFVS